MAEALIIEDLLFDYGGGMSSDLASVIHSRLASHRAVLLLKTGMSELSEMADWATDNRAKSH
jgi:hypothetical protein